MTSGSVSLVATLAVTFALVPVIGHAEQPPTNNVCPAGQVVRGIASTGAVICTAAVNGDISAVLAGPGLQGGGTSGDVSIGLARTAGGAFDLSSDGGFIAAEGFGPPRPLSVSGRGTRLFWYPARGAFRSGSVNATNWDDANIGYQSVAMGNDTLATGFSSVALGERTVATGNFSFAVGLFAQASGGSSVAMGARAHAGGTGSIALGDRVSASTDGTFMFGDRSDFSDASTVDLLTFARNQFLVRAAGGTGFYSNASLSAGVVLLPGAGAWSSVSDANLKEHFRDLDAGDVLERIARMPIREWNYKAQDVAIRHVGPTAQDFHAAFGLGEDPLKISTIDADGIALRAIQALESRTRDLGERLKEIEALKAQIVTMQAALAALQAVRR